LSAQSTRVISCAVHVAIQPPAAAYACASLQLVGSRQAFMSTHEGGWKGEGEGDGSGLASGKGDGDGVGALTPARPGHETPPGASRAATSDSVHLSAHPPARVWGRASAQLVGAEGQRDGSVMQALSAPPGDGDGMRDVRTAHDGVASIAAAEALSIEPLIIEVTEPPLEMASQMHVTTCVPLAEP